MKKIVFVFGVLFISLVSNTYGQDSLYVSATGSESIGFSEASPGKSLINALLLAKNGYIKKIIVLGVIDLNSDFLSRDFIRDNGAVFGLPNLPSYGDDSDPQEILITGKHGASGAQRAVISGRNSGASVLSFSDNVRIRFEHIEISGGEVSENSAGAGLLVIGKSIITLGQGAIVRMNQKFGVGVIAEGTVTLDGGEVQDNQGGGFYVNINGNLVIRNGTVKNNRSPNNGGGVFISRDGNLTMSGGSITGNRSLFGGGVTIFEGGAFTMSGGFITNNTAVGGGGIYVQKGGHFVQTGGNISNNGANTEPNIYRE
jgi:hypothetical protein